MQNNSLILPDEFLARTQELKDNIRNKIKDISAATTPQVDGTGLKIRAVRDDGYEYVIEAFMRTELDRLFPGWSWEPQGPPLFLGAEWVYWWGILSIVDENLIGLGVIPPIRKFGAGNAVRSGANSKAFKKAINMLTHICDDVYKKRLDYDGMGSYEDVLASTNSVEAFNAIIKKTYGARWGDIFKILGVSSLAEIKDFSAALATIKEAKGY